MVKKESTDARFIDLDECVIQALEMLSRTTLPTIDIKFKRPLVVGSGNAEITGKLIFDDRDAVYANESNYMQKLAAVPWVDGCVLISASGGKHAPIIAQEVSKQKKKVVLITNNPEPAAKTYVHETIIFPKNPEPYTYNTSTYLSMLLGKTHEQAGEILAHIKELQKKIPSNLKSYNAIYFILPNSMDAVRPMFITKFDELFGPMIAGRAYTLEQTKHAKTIVPSDKELFVSFGEENKFFGKKKWNIPLPEHYGYGLVIALGYYVIGQIQKQHPPYFKKNIDAYCEQVSKLFGEKILPFVS